MLVGSSACGSATNQDIEAGDALQAIDTVAPDMETLDPAGDASGCEPGTQICARGVVGTCTPDGTGWTYSACPEGQVCELDACVPNVPVIVLVTNTAPLELPGGTEPPLPEALSRTMYDALCAESPQCCESFASSTTSTQLSTIMATKYWIRRLVDDLRAAGDYVFTLLGPPTAAADVSPPYWCAAHEVDACLTGDSRLLSNDEWRDLIASVYPEDTVVLSTGAPATIAGVSSTDGFRDLMRATVKAEDTDPEAILRWVDSRISDGTSGTGVDPELNVEPAQYFNMALAAYLYLSLEARPEGRTCDATSDCGHVHYRCIEGVCRDPASACRVYDLVFLTSFMRVVDNSWGSTGCTGGDGFGVDHNVWSQWLSSGVACDPKTNACWPGSSCIEPCDYTTWEPCDYAPVCLPDDLADATSDPVVQLRMVFGDYLSAFPGPFPTDAADRRFRVRTHAISTGFGAVDPYIFGYGAVEYATATAVSGSGVAVTPCVPTVEQYWSTFPDVSRFASCAFSDAYVELVSSLAARHGSLCTPEAVGLVPAP